MLKLLSRALAACAAAGAICLSTAAVAGPAPAAIATAVEKVLVDSAAAYSNGDFKGFIASYEVSPDTTYISGDKVITGYDAIAATYGARFAAKAEAPANSA